MKRFFLIFLLIATCGAAYAYQGPVTVIWNNVSLYDAWLNTVYDWPETTAGFSTRHLNFQEDIVVHPGQSVTNTALGGLSSTNLSNTYGGYTVIGAAVAYQIGSTSQASELIPLTISGDGEYLNFNIIGPESATNVPPPLTPVYTNFTYCISNTFATPMLATWTFNGAQAKAEMLPAAGSDCWTTPSIEIYPVMGPNFTVGIALTAPLVGWQNPFQEGPNGGITFGDLPSPTNTFYNGSPSGSGGSGGGGTNTLSGGTLPPVQSAPTNLVTFPPPTGAASESTLAGGFQLLHGDMLNLLTGQKVQNDTLNGGFAVVTNQLGQILRYDASNSDEMPVIVGYLSNLTRLPTNPVANTASSNVNVMNWPESWSNNLSQIASNSQYLANLTNLASGNTNLVYSNVEGRMNSLIPDSATNATAATAAATAAITPVLGVFDTVMADFVTTPDIGGDPGHSSSWEMDFCGSHIDLDPVNNFPVAVTFAHALFTFLATLIYLFFIGRLWIKAVQFLNTAQTGGVPNMDVFAGAQALTFGSFFGGNFIGVAVAVVMPAVFLLIWMVFLTAVITPLGLVSGAFQAIADVITSLNSTTSGSMASHLLFSFFPLVFILRLITAALLIQFTLGKAAVLASAASRYLFGK